LGVDIFSASGRSAIRIERARYDDDTYYRRFARRWGETRHDAELTLALSRTHFLRGIELEAGLQLSRRYGRDFLTLDDDGRERIDNNVSTRLAASWRPSF
jgi:hypothetical protein